MKNGLLHVEPRRGAKPVQGGLPGDVGGTRSRLLHAAAAAREEASKEHPRETQGQGHHRRRNARLEFSFMQIDTAPLILNQKRLSPVASRRDVF